MKKLILTAFAVFAAHLLWAQEPGVSSPDSPASELPVTRADSLGGELQPLPDSLYFGRFEQFAQPDFSLPAIPSGVDLREVLPWEKHLPPPQTSVVLVPRRNLPVRVMVFDNNVLRLKRGGLSNGQAWNWSPYPDGYLDARTLSFPMRPR